MEVAPTVSRSRQIAAWLLHVLTASGAVLGFTALEAAMRADAPMTFLWLGLALIVDGVDGPIARALDVERTTPNIDGTALDLVVDYLTYVVAPVAYLTAASAYPAGTGGVFGAFILLTSLYTFARRDMKADSADFRGFPATWNLVAAAFVVTGAAPWTAAAVTIVLGLLTFTNLRAVHPIRVVALRPWTIAATILWLAASAVAIAKPGWLAPLPLIVWWTATAYVVGLCLWRSATEGMAPNEKGA